MTHIGTEAPIAWASSEEARRFQTRWAEVQAGFVSDPRGALQRADALVSDLVSLMTVRLTEERRSLQARWEPAETPTETLRVVMQRYRDVFEGLLE
jgi:hypothetical protein